MVVLLLVLAAGLVAMGCVKADRVRRWRESFNPSAPELPDSAFVVARVALFAMAGIGVFSALQFMAVVADAEWSDDELASAVSQAAKELNGTSRFGDIYGDDSGFDEEFATMIEDEVVENGGGGAPQSGVNAGAAASNQPSGADYTVTAAGADASFCVHVVRTRSKEGDYEPPGIAGNPSTVTVPNYDFAVTSRTGAC
ncbi:hypothetical protein B046DRAFT_07048 [Streptomyces sp. LamerLS-316]|uniref:hypothetical protein n=1 Tax=unclassified Streptomyces TaxID=2593676 RepID=UPI000823B7DB|nr:MULTISPECIES: hypothetical protein [unclassified Streptomyces]MYQ38912.1 hypothetical protein [Streptomyces sp. SID4921]SCK26258.1 hypothetical protein B046DRAFT_07048 [Streptomyces sp. LamerLS-316]